VGATTTLSNTTPGGFWISGATTIATVDSFTGIVTGVSPGTADIGYQTSTWIVSKTVTVNPRPTLSSPLTPASVCDSTIFSYTPLSSTPGTTFAWSRAVVAGIIAPASTGAGNPNEQLINTTYVPIGVVYVYTLSAAGCINTQTVTVTVNPLPVLSSTLTPPAICDSALFSYIPTSATPGSSFAWNRPAVSGIMLPTSFGTGAINEVLDNTTSGPIVVTYVFRLSIGGCINLYTEEVKVTVYTCRVGIHNLSKAADEINVYPNPNPGNFTVEVPENKATITLSDLTGRVIETRDIEPGSPIKESFNLNHLPSGTYVLKVCSEDRTYIQKVVIW
jgi:hypothetical protein